MFVAVSNEIKLKIIPSDRGNSQNLLCEGDQLRWLCTATGSILRWNNSRALTFTSHDQVDKVLADGKLAAFLLNKTYNVSSGEWEFISELRKLGIASTISPISTTCRTNTDSKKLLTNIAGSYFMYL